MAFERALQLDPDSALTEASAASPYIQEGDDARAIAHLERAITIDPLFLPAASTLIGLYGKQGKLTEAAKLSARIRIAMSERPAGPPAAQNGATADGGKNAEEVFKNIKLLKGVPSDQLIPAMQFMASSLGVECSFCHVQGHFDQDDKKPKQTARDMMQMMFALNRNNFEGRREVTCYSCHRGSPNPVAAPIIVDPETQSSPRASNSETQAPAGLPSASRLIDNYILALGGAAAIQKITSRKEKGVTNLSGKSVSVEIFIQVPDKWLMVRHLSEGDSIVAFDGRAGWISVPGRPTREMHGPDIEAARMDADLQFPLHIQQMFPDLRVDYPEKIGDRDADVLFCFRDGHPAAKVYFDQQTGLLVRLVGFADSPLGVNPSQIDYADYRDVDGVKVPFRVTLSQPGSSFSIQMDDVQSNVLIDPARFAKPMPERLRAPPVHP